MAVFLAFAAPGLSAAAESCLDCHGTTAAHFQLEPVDRTVVCRVCHYGSHQTMQVETAYGWFKTAESPLSGPATLHSSIHSNAKNTSGGCGRCHVTASCAACHKDIPHATHASTQISPVTVTTTLGGFGSIPGPETFYCGTCHSTLPDINRNTCYSCHSVGLDGHTDAARTHGDFNATTAACAGCHSAHAAPGPQLMKAGTQTELCFLCHGYGATLSPFDVQRGLVYNPTSAQWENTSAGGFSEYAGSAVTSRHSVEGFSGDNAASYDLQLSGYIGDLPGGSSPLTGRGLQCSFCHNPHGGTHNVRLLRNDFYTGAVGRSVRATTGANKIISYDQGFAEWCTGCHARFLTTQGTGSSGVDFNGVMTFRHAMNVGIADLASVSDTTMNGTPLQTGKYEADSTKKNALVCVSCHRAHGTSSQAVGLAVTWRRDTDAAGAASGSGSALLRMHSRGVCWNCHGAAERNIP
jgi:predicted CXXCH cytochrome family protein